MLSLLLSRVQKHFSSTEFSCQAYMKEFFHKNGKMVSIINYFHDKAPSQISDSVLNMPPISMVTEKLYLINNSGQLISLTNKSEFAERLFYIFQVFLFSLFLPNFIFLNNCNYQNYNKY